MIFYGLTEGYLGKNQLSSTIMHAHGPFDQGLVKGDQTVTKNCIFFCHFRAPNLRNIATREHHENRIDCSLISREGFLHVETRNMTKNA